ncbi:phosphatidate cytidylyltransferase 2-like [Styela clava]
METRQRKKHSIDKAGEERDSAGDSPSDELSAPEPHPPAVQRDDTPEILKEALKDLPPKWKNWWIRGFFTIFMLLGFLLLVWGGPFAFMLIIIAIQVKCFHEIITIGHQFYRSYDLPWFRTLSWYFLVCSNYFFYGETRAEMFSNLMDYKFVSILLKYHRLISFTLYLIGFMLFVLSLVKKRYRLQFFMFGWTHVTLLIIVSQSHLIMTNLLDGMVWLLVPVSMVICNDSMAYITGFFFGRTPLIKLSPKKTWEGFIGGGIFTVLLGWIFAGYLSQYKFLVCPTEIRANFQVYTDCELPSTFLPAEYEIPLFVQVFLKLVGLQMTTFTAIPFQLHCLAIGMFSSIIAPFGGFFASGFKRAFKVKDFGDVIPGHGGMMDRFDCQFLVATFVFVYMSAFIRVPTPNKILPTIFAMKTEDQLWLFERLRTHLNQEI